MAFVGFHLVLTGCLLEIGLNHHSPRPYVMLPALLPNLLVTSDLDVKLVLNLLIDFLCLFPLVLDSLWSFNRPELVRILDKGRVSLLLLCLYFFLDLLSPELPILPLDFLFLSLLAFFVLGVLPDLFVKLLSLLHETLHLHVQALLYHFLLG